MTAGTVTGAMARALAGHGYRVVFPPGRDPAVFKVTGLPGSPEVEVSAGDDGWTACHYTGRTAAEAARVIGRLPVPGHPQITVATACIEIAAWDGIVVEWHYLPPDGQPAFAQNSRWRAADG